MLAPWKKSYNQLRQHIKKQRHYFPNKVHLVKAMVFPIVMYGCKNWTIKKAEFYTSFFTLFFYFHQEAFQFLFTFCHKSDVICISEVIDISPGNLDISPGNLLNT